MKKALLFSVLCVVLASCVSMKKYKTAKSEIASLSSKNEKLNSDLKNCGDIVTKQLNEKAILETQLKDKNSQFKLLNENNTSVLKQLENLSVISSSQAESIKKSLENIQAKDYYIKSLQDQIAYKDSLNLSLVTNLKGSIGEDEDINIKVDKGVVYIDISDKMLFKSGSYIVTDKAKVILGKVAIVLKNHPDIEFLIEGHTDTNPYKNGLLLDNWDLSVKRATSVVRILQKEYGLSPASMTAAGRGEYSPIATNKDKKGRSINRRTRIVILPKLDQFFELLEKK